MVSRTTVSPEFTRSTGGWALSNQPHWVVSSVAGSRCIFLPFGKFTTRSWGSAGPTPGEPGGGVGAGGGGCGADAVGGNCGAAAGAGAGDGEVCASSAVVPRIKAPPAPSAMRDSKVDGYMFFPPNLIFSNYCLKYRPLKLVSAIHCACGFS